MAGGRTRVRAGGGVTARRQVKDRPRVVVIAHRGLLGPPPDALRRNGIRCD